jgi:transposase-like protein
MPSGVCAGERTFIVSEALLAVKNMSGETAQAWRVVLDHLIKRGLRKPEFLIVDGGSGVDRALAELWSDVPTQHCTVHKHRNLLAHVSSERLPFSALSHCESRLR